MSFTFAIGDIHGCHTQLEQLLTAIEFICTDGTVVLLGDYIDRGPANRAVVERIVAGPAKPDWTWITLMGNHEELMVSALRHRKHVSMWLENGGAEKGTRSWAACFRSSAKDAMSILARSRMG